MARFDRRLWHRFWILAKPYWFSDEKWKAWGLLALLIGLLLGETQFSVLFNQQSGGVTSALAAKDSRRFWRAIGVSSDWSRSRPCRRTSPLTNR